MLCAFFSDKDALRVSNPELPAGQQQIGEVAQREQLHGVPGQAAIVRLTMTEQLIDDTERMLDFGTHARFRVLQLFRDTTRLFSGSAWCLSASWLTRRYLSPARSRYRQLIYSDQRLAKKTRAFARGFSGYIQFSAVCGGDTAPSP
jgi:hypothetical protein